MKHSDKYWNKQLEGMRIKDMDVEYQNEKASTQTKAVHSKPNYEDEWIFIVENHGEDLKSWRRIPGIRDKIARGVPSNIRSVIWKLLLKPKYKHNYDTIARRECEYTQQICADVKRTLVEREDIRQFEGVEQSGLNGVLHAIANAMPGVGYCQGMGDICAVLLSRYSEKETFSIFLALVTRERIHGLFDGNLSLIPQIISKQQRVLERTIPKIYAHLCKERVDLVFCVAGWYITLFSRFERRLCERIWDFLFFYGFWMLPYFVAAILKYHEKEISSFTGENLLMEIGNLNKTEYDPDVIVCLALKLREIDHT